MLIRSDQAESARGKNVVVDDNAPPRMIKPKNPEVGVWKTNERKRQLAPRPKPTVKQLLDKYTSRKANNVFNRLGGTKRPRSPSGPGGYEHWRGNSYDQQPYFVMEPAYWGGAPPVYPQFPPWGYNPWAPYPTGPACYFQPEWISPRPMFRPDMHEKRARFNQEARSHDAIVARGNRLPVHRADDQNYRGDRQRVWVPVKRAESKSVSSEDLDAAHGPKLGKHQSAKGVVNGMETSRVDELGSGQIGSDLVQNNATLELIRNGKDNNTHAEDVVTRNGPKHGCIKNIAANGSSLHVDLEPKVHIHSEKLVVRPSASKSAVVSAAVYAGGSRKYETGGPSHQQKVFSAKYREFAPKTAVRQYRPGNSGGSRIMSVAPGTKPGPQWCPTGLTHTQKRRVQRLRAMEIKDKIAEKKRDEWFSRDRPMVPTKTWKEKRIAAEENKNTDEMNVDQNSENKDDAPTDMDVNMVFALPADFRAPEIEVAELALGPKNATFEKPEKHGQHLKPLFIRGHIDGKPIGRMLVDGGAGVNIMPFSVFSKLNRKENELMKTNMGLSGFSGELSEAKGVISMELTVGSKTLPTAFFVVDVKGRYNILLGRDWIHANCCIPSTLHQCLIQWVDDDVEVIEADNLACIALAETQVDWQRGEMRCLTGRDLSDYDYISIGKDGFVPVHAQPASVAWLNNLSL